MKFFYRQTATANQPIIFDSLDWQKQEFHGIISYKGLKSIRLTNNTETLLNKCFLC